MSARDILKRSMLCAAATLSGVGASAIHAQALPLWEVGLGLGALSLPFYRGAASGRTYSTLFPYGQYRGEHLRIDQEGIRGYLFSSERVKLDMSLAGGVPVPSDGSNARRGMPGLDPTVEIGPSLHLLLWNAAAGDRAFWLKLPLRAAFSVTWGNIEHHGWNFAPYLEYAMDKGNPAQPWKINLSAGPQFADRAYHDYFYEVAPPYAIPGRAEYYPASGYSGSRFTLVVQKKWNGYWLGAFARYDALQGAVFSDSPLVERKNYYALGAAVIKLLAVSKKPEQIP